MKILVTGDRNGFEPLVIEDHLTRIAMNGERNLLIEGGARGVDTQARDIASRIGTFDIATCHAQWDKYGRAAGPIRNQFMLDTYHPDKVLAFHKDLAHSKGTKDMVNRAKIAGIPVEVIE